MQRVVIFALASEVEEGRHRSQDRGDEEEIGGVHRIEIRSG